MNRTQMEKQVSKPGLYENIHNKRKRGEPMRKKGDLGAPSDNDFKNAAKTAKNKKSGYKNGGMVNSYKNGGCVMGNRGVRNTKMV